MSKHPFRGMGVALVTPFTEEQEVDYKSLERLLEHLLRDGATDFIVIHGTTGESPCLTRQERQRVTEHIIEQVAGRCPLMIGLGGNNTRETGERLRELDTRGLSGVLSVVPYYNKPSQEGMYRHFAHLATEGPLPLVLYNVPGRVGVNMAPIRPCAWRVTLIILSVLRRLRAIRSRQRRLLRANSLRTLSSCRAMMRSPFPSSKMEPKE